MGFFCGFSIDFSWIFLARNLSVFLWRGRDVRGEILRTENFFFFFLFSMELLGMFLLVICFLLLGIRKCKKSLCYYHVLVGKFIFSGFVFLWLNFLGLCSFLFMFKMKLDLNSCVFWVLIFFFIFYFVKIDQLIFKNQRLLWMLMYLF